MSLNENNNGVETTAVLDNKDTLNNIMEKHNVVKEAEPNKEG